MAISYDKKIMECVLRSVMSEGNVAQGKAIKSICKSPKPLFITGRAGTGKSFFIKRIVPALKMRLLLLLQVLLLLMQVVKPFIHFLE